MFRSWRTSEACKDLISPSIFSKQQFSWWDYRGNGYERGHGLRIDHLLLSPMAADKLAGCEIDEAPRREEKPSDHAPVICTLKL